MAEGIEKNGKCVLVVEDEPLIVELMKKILTDEGYEVDTSLCAEEGHALMIKKEYDLVLFDYHLPEKNGYAFVQEAQWNKEKTKMILITGNMPKEKLSDMYRAGISSCLYKPFEKKELFDVISECFGEQSKEV